MADHEETPNTSFEKPRHVVKTALAEPEPEGVGATLRKSIGREDLGSLDPFVVLLEFLVSPPAGFPDHPHRGFEAVTYVLEGAFSTQDITGHKATIRAGDMQLMTIGRGIIHSEMPGGEGESKVLQLWINLSSKDKMMEPSYQEMQSKDISRAEKDGVYVRIIAGESLGVRSPINTQTPTMFLDFTLKPGAEVHQPISEAWNAFVFIIEGEGVFGDPDASPATSHHALVLGPGDGLGVWNRSEKALRFLLIGGQPLGERVVVKGPFVMSTEAEIEKAIEDYRGRRNGFETPTAGSL